jgi:hypothetical protein
MFFIPVKASEKTIIPFPMAKKKNESKDTLNSVDKASRTSSDTSLEAGQSNFANSSKKGSVSSSEKLSDSTINQEARFGTDLTPLDFTDAKNVKEVKGVVGFFKVLQMGPHQPTNIFLRSYLHDIDGKIFLKIERWEGGSIYSEFEVKLSTQSKESEVIKINAASISQNIAQFAFEELSRLPQEVIKGFSQLEFQKESNSNFMELQFLSLIKADEEFRTMALGNYSLQRLSKNTRERINQIEAYEIIPTEYLISLADFANLKDLKLKIIKSCKSVF